LNVWDHDDNSDSIPYVDVKGRIFFLVRKMEYLNGLFAEAKVTRILFDV